MYTDYRVILESHTLTRLDTGETGTGPNSLDCLPPAQVKTLKELWNSLLQSCLPKGRYSRGTACSH